MARFPAAANPDLGQRRGIISVPRMNHEFDEPALVLSVLLPVISIAARNLDAKTKISQLPALTSFEAGPFELP